MKAFDNLIGIAAQAGLDVLYVEVLDESWKPASRVIYHSRLKSGPAPVQEYCRDDLDYELKTKSWKKDGLVYSEWYRNLDELVKQEIKRLKKEIKRLYG